MNIILSMTLSGTVVYILYRCFVGAGFISFPPGIHYIILKTVLIYHIIPGGYIVEGINYMFALGHKQFDDYIFISGKDPFIAFTPEGPRTNTVFNIYLSIFCIWLFMALVIFMRQIVLQNKLRKNIMNSSKEITSGPAYQLLCSCKTNLKLRRRIRLYSSGTYAFTFGIFHPMIVIPEISDVANLKLIIYHELIHIKRNDPFIRFLYNLVKGIFWFNPLIYSICRETEKYCEISCDGLVTCNMDLKGKARYSDLIIEMASYTPKPSLKHVTSFSKNQTVLKERIDFIMMTKKRKNRAALLLSMVCMLCGTFPAFAYSPPQSLLFSGNGEADIINYSVHECGELSFNNFSEIVFTEEIANIVYDSQFTDIYGNVYNVDEHTTLNNCEHVYVDGIYDKHIRNSRGGCTLKNYNAQRCTNCGDVRLGTLIEQHQYTVCPH